MNIALFTSNQPRHVFFAEKLIAMGHNLHLVQEVSTLMPGKKKGIFRRSETMARYFERVIAAERALFGQPRAVSSAASVVQVPMREISGAPLNKFEQALGCDAFILFGCSYIKGDLAEALIAKKAVNIHMGISPFFRGNSCNFWALYDDFPEHVGATVHRLDKGLDSGPILFYSFPKVIANDPFVYTMSAVQSVFDKILAVLDTGTFNDIKGISQDRDKEIRYSRGRDFTDEIAEDFMARNFPTEDIKSICKARGWDLSPDDLSFF
ncbi:formyltransferase family protein [Hellea sp.]|nr:formyltransferase family protein [Hellea sp.]